MLLSPNLFTSGLLDDVHEDQGKQVEDRCQPNGDKVAARDVAKEACDVRTKACATGHADEGDEAPALRHFLTAEDNTDRTGNRRNVDAVEEAKDNCVHDEGPDSAATIGGQAHAVVQPKSHGSARSRRACEP